MKKRSKRLIFSAKKETIANKEEIAKNPTESKFHAYEDKSAILPRRRINTGQMLNVLK